MADRIPGLDRIKRAGSLLRDITNRIDSLPVVADRATRTAGKNFSSLTRNIDETNDAVRGLSRSMDKLSTGPGRNMMGTLNKLGKAVTSLGTSIIGMGINLLIDGIQRVYELKERWAKVTGAMRMQIGGLSANVKSATKLMSNWEGTMHGLTGQFGIGSQMANEFASTLETMNKRIIEGSTFIGKVLARGFNLGGKAAGELMRAMRSIGVDGKATTENMARMTQLAAKFEVPVNAVAQDLHDARDMMVAFGKDGVKSMIRSSVYLRQFNIGLKDTNNLMNTFDRFDSATEATAKLNTAFGTTISSLDMLLTDDPAERIEKVRQQLLSQGRTYETMTRKQRIFLAETMGLENEQIAMLLDRNKANVSFLDMQEKAAKAEKKEINAKKLMQKHLRATAQTMYSFSQAMDEITVAIAKALRPLLEALGLVKSSKKEWKGFASVMRGATNVFVRFFEGLAKSPKWISMMQRLADALKSAAKWIAGLTVKDFSQFFDAAVGAMQRIFTWVKRIAILWAGMRIGTAGLAFAGAAKGLLGGAGGAVKGMGGVAGVGLGVAGGAIGGGAIGGLLGGNTTGGSVGGAIGGGAGAMLGSAFGPLGQMLGGAIGTALGGAVGAGVQFIAGKIGDMVDRGAATGLSYYEGVLEKEKKKNATIEKEMVATASRTSVLNKVIHAEREHELGVLRRLAEQNEDRVELMGNEREVVQRLVKNMISMGVETGLTDAQMKELSKQGGSLVLTKTMLDKLYGSTERLHTSTNSLANEMLEAAGAAKAMREAQAKKEIADIAIAREENRRKRGITELEGMKGGGRYADIARTQGFTAALTEIRKSGPMQEMQTLQSSILNREKRGLASPQDKKRLEHLKRQHSGLLKMEETLMKFSRSDKELLRLRRDQMSVEGTILRQNELKARLTMLGIADADAMQRVQAKLGGASETLMSGEEQKIYEGLLDIKRARVKARAQSSVTIRGNDGRPMNLASGATGAGGGQGGPIQVVAGDVYLDGDKVGRTQVKWSAAGAS